MKSLLSSLIAILLAGCERPSAQRAEPPLDPKLALAVDALADHAVVEGLNEYSPNPVGKYQAMSIYGWPARLDTQSGRLWILVPARTQYNPGPANIWKELVVP